MKPEATLVWKMFRAECASEVSSAQPANEWAELAKKWAAQANARMNEPSALSYVSIHGCFTP